MPLAGFYQELATHNGFLAKGGNAWHFMKLPGKTCVLPPYEETVPDGPRRLGPGARGGVVRALSRAWKRL